MGMKKRRHHYVFQAYLSAWTVEDKLWCMRNKESVFNTGTLNVAQERDFYRIKPLNEDEIKFYNLFMYRGESNIQRAMNRHMQDYLMPLEWKENIEKLRHFMEQKYGGADKIPAELKKEFTDLERKVDVSINDLEEDYHGDLEGDGAKWLDLLRKKDMRFLLNTQEPDKGYFDDDRFFFLYFLCVQYFRTKAMRERWISNFETCFQHPQWNSLNIPKENIHMENLAHHFFWEMQNRMAYNLRKQNANIALLVNNTAIPFVTSDQPVINLCADYQNLEEEVTELTFYYPVSPQIAVMVNGSSAGEIELDEQEVDKYNRAVIDASYQCIFADRPEVFERYVKND